MFAMLLALLPFGQACQHAERDEPPAPTRPAQPGAGGPQLSQEPYLTLAQIEADPYTTLVAVPGGYSLSQAGIWPYTEAFLLVAAAGGSVQGDTAEVYVFDTEEGYRTPVTCNYAWIECSVENGNRVAAGCKPSGNDCTVSERCVIRCRPA